ncbi:MAG: hypothetical protein EOM17_11850, partial [Synergistales bacterium]|nr:hypothetical protein [Synergistales bacterium]
MNRSVAVFLCMLWLGLTPPAASSAPKILTGGGAGEVMRTVPLSPAILSQTGRKVSLSGFYYGGSVPMIIDDISRTDYNMELPEGSFIPLEGPRPAGLKSGDRITVAGMLKQPDKTSPLKNSRAVLKISGPEGLRITTPRVLPPAKIKPRKPEILRRLEKFRPGDLIPGRKFAVLIAGGGGPENNHIRYWNDLLTMYTVLLGRGFAAADIFVYYADGAPPGDVEGKIDGTMPVNGVANRTNIQRCFRNIGNVSGDNDFIYILTNDHGGGFLEVRTGTLEPGLHKGRITTTGEPDDSISEAQYGLDLNGDGDRTDVMRADESLILWSGRYYDNDFASDLNQISRYGTMVIHVEQCFSGGFLDDLRAPRRIIFSAASGQRLSRAHTTSSANPQPVQPYNEIFYWFVTALLGETPDGDYAVDRNGAPWTSNAD